MLSKISSWRCAWALGCLLGMGMAGVASADDTSNAINAVIAQQMRDQRIPGLALLVIHGEETVSAGYGLANLEHEVPVTPETVFQSGSMGKQFTAAAVLLLVEEGRLALDDPVAKYLESAPASWSGITVRQLLSHTAGVGNLPPLFNYRQDYSEKKLAELIFKMPLIATPGERWQYSNPGYIILGNLIGKVSGKHYGEFLAERIFRPLGMDSTRVISEADIVPDRAAGYKLVDGQWKNQDWVSPSLNTTADGSLYINLLDLAKWNAALTGDELLKPTSKEQWWTPTLLANGQANPAHYGFGWMLRPRRGHRVQEHGGAWQGFTTHLARFPDDQLTVAVLTNLSAESGANPGQIAHAVAGLCVPDLLPAIRTIAEAERESTMKLLSERLTAFFAGQANRDDYGGDAREVLFSEAVKPITARIAKLGAWKSFEHVESQGEDDQTVWKCRAVYQGGTAIEYHVRLDKEHRIVELLAEFP